MTYKIEEDFKNANKYHICGKNYENGSVNIEDLLLKNVT